VRFDLAETVTSEPPQAHSRAGNEMARAGFGANNSSNVYRMGTGAISLTPFQKTLTQQTEQTDSALTMVALADFDTIPGYTERPHYRAPSGLVGITLAPATASSGLLMAEKTVPAAQSGGFDQSLTADIAAMPQPQYNTVLTTIDRHAVSKVTFDDNQAHTFRFRTPFGHQYTASTTCFQFGGPVNANGNGQYNIEVCGQYIYLWEYTAAKGTFPWVVVDHWQYVSVANPGEWVTIHVRPYRTPRGNMGIEFEVGTQATVSNAGNSQLNMQVRAAPQGITTHLFKVNTRPDAPSAPPVGTPPRQKVTGSGPVRIDMARELRVPWQVSVWRYFSSGFFEDFPFSMPWYVTTREILRLYWTADVPGNSTITMRFMDYTSRAELTPTGVSGAGYKEYQVNPGQGRYYLRCEMTSTTDQKLSPVLHDYSLQRDSHYITNDPGEFEADADSAQGVRISGPEADPSHESASLVLCDMPADLTIFNKRAVVRTRIETEYDPDDTDLRSVIFDGYLQEAQGDQQGTDANQGGGGGAERFWPSPEWKNYHCSFAGMWVRLHKTLTMFRLDLQKPDPNGPVDANGEHTAPFKVTDICRALLGYAGFTPGQIDVPDSPIRFYPGGAENGQTLMIDPLSNVAEAVLRFAKEYLGWFLIWDGNAGTEGGMWRLRPPVPVQGPYNNLATFTLDLPDPGKLTTASESYNGDTGGKAWVGENPTIYIEKGTMKPFVKPPEGNAVCVTATGQYLPENGQFALSNWICNPKSYNCFVDTLGNTIETADPEDPDYLPFFCPIIIVSLGVGDQHTVDVICRRVYDVSCHGIRILPFEAPLALITDPDDTHQTNPRPLRFYDPVLVVRNGEESQWLVRNCNPTYVKDSIQYAYYELEAPRTD